MATATGKRMRKKVGGTRFALKRRKAKGPSKYQQKLQRWWGRVPEDRRQRVR